MTAVEFGVEMERLFALYDKPHSERMWLAWWEKFGRYRLADFRIALDEAMVDAGFMPGAGHVWKHLRAAHPELTPEQQKAGLEHEQRERQERAVEPNGCPPEERERLAAIFKGSSTRGGQMRSVRNVLRGEEPRPQERSPEEFERMRSEAQRGLDALSPANLDTTGGAEN